MSLPDTFPSRFWAALLSLAPLAGAAQTLTNDGAQLTVQAGTTLFVAGDVQQNPGATLTSAGAVQLTGSFTNAGTLASAGTLLFSGGADQTFAPGAATVASLTLGNTGAAGANRLFIPADLTVSGLLTLTQGLVRTQGSAGGSSVFTLSLPDGARVVGEAPGRYVQGRLAVTRAGVGATAVDFTNGLALDPGGQPLGTVTVTRTAGLQTAGLSYGTNLGGTTKGIDRVWQVVASQPLSSSAPPATATLSWVSDDDNGFNPATPAQLWRADQASGPWVAQGAPASASTRSLTATLTQLGVLTVSNTSQPLPVTLVSFAATAQADDALLQWATASEADNAYFDAEASPDGRAFSRIGQVAGHGTTTLARQYQLLDKNIARYAASPVYYRLRQVDTDGRATYSPVRLVRVAAPAAFAAEVYPSPTGPAATPTLLVHTATAGALTWQLVDGLGRTLRSQTSAVPAGASSLPLGSVADLATGVYLVRVQQGRQQQTLRLIRE